MKGAKSALTMVAADRQTASQFVDADYPLVRDRREDPFCPATWDEALDRTCAALTAEALQATAI